MNLPVAICCHPSSLFVCAPLPPNVLSEYEEHRGDSQSPWPRQIKGKGTYSEGKKQREEENEDKDEDGDEDEDEDEEEEEEEEEEGKQTNGVLHMSLYFC